jgi:hypothetical protein
MHGRWEVSVPCFVQALLLWTQMVLFYWYTMSLYWSPATSTTAKLHLRILIALKSLSFTFSALQLRNGYPPPASYRCLFWEIPTSAAPAFAAIPRLHDRVVVIKCKV